MKRLDHFPLNGRQLDVRTVATSEAGQLHTHFLAFQLRRDAACKDYDVGVFHLCYRTLYVRFFFKAQIEVELGIAGEVLEFDFDVIRFSGIHVHSVGARTAAVFVCEAAYLFAVHQQFDGTVAIEVEDYFSRLLRGEYALIRGGEVGQVYARSENGGSGSTETERGSQSGSGCGCAFKFCVVPVAGAETGAFLGFTLVEYAAYQCAFHP